jgi:hypothetical protein
MQIGGKSTRIEPVPERRSRMDELKDEHLLTIVKNVVEQHGCRLVDIDFETHRIDIEGSEDAKAQSARALQDILG